MLVAKCNLEEECRNGFRVTKEMKQLWNIQLNMLQCLLDICEEYHIKVFASSGTMLGAVRHKGFIPWDDDIDVDMLREDYDKLINLPASVFKAPYFLQTAYSDTGYYRGHAQLRYNGTSQILYGDLHHDFNQSIFIDIFVLDNVPDDESDKSELIASTSTIQNFLWNRRYKYHLAAAPLAWYRNRRACARLGVDIHADDRKVFNYFESLFKNPKFKNSRKVAYLSYDSTDSRNYFDRNWFDEVEYVDFEDMKIPVPVKFHEVLTQLYGPNYMTPMQLATMHGGFYLSFDRNYTEVLKEKKDSIFSLLMSIYKQRLKNLFNKIWPKH